MIYLQYEQKNMESQTYSPFDLSEKKKDWYKACIVTYQIGDWIKAGLYP